MSEINGVNMKSDIEAIIFDFGGVMVDFRQLDSFQKQEARLELQPGKLAEILWQSPDWRLAEVGAITPRSQYRGWSSPAANPARSRPPDTLRQSPPGGRRRLVLRLTP